MNCDHLSRCYCQFFFLLMLVNHVRFIKKEKKWSSCPSKKTKNWWFIRGEKAKLKEVQVSPEISASAVTNLSYKPFQERDEEKKVCPQQKEVKQILIQLGCFFVCVCVLFFFLSVADYELNDSEIMISRSSGWSWNLRMPKRNSLSIPPILDK